jgi:hypothetical protein
MNKFILTIFIFLSALCFLLPSRASAAATGKVSGYAWGENLGWISFASTTPIDYGVTISTSTGNLSGYAWSSNLGWISFNEVNPPDNYVFNSSCLYACDNNNPYCTACFNKTDKNIYGWVKVLSMGTEGWIKLNDASWADGVKIPDPDDGSFSGWAWNANDNGHGIGWISFNSTDAGATGGSAYKVVADLNTKPTVTNLTAPNLSYAEVCNSSVNYRYLQDRLKWTFNDLDPGSSESAYQIIFNNNNNTTTPIFDTGKCTAWNGANCRINPGVLNYPAYQQASSSFISDPVNTIYYWWVRSWDDFGATSSWSAVHSFTNYKHDFPEVDFSWLPVSPSAGQNVTFTNTTPSDGAAITSFSWVFQNGNPSTISTTSPSVITSFSATGAQDITLTATDSDGYYCGGQKSLSNVNFCSPVWIEQKPQ